MTDLLTSPENNADEKWEFDFDGWTLGEDATYMTTVQRVYESGDFSPLYGHWARMIRCWPFALDPRHLRNYDKLDRSVHTEIIERIERAIRAPKRPEGRLGGGET